MARPKKVDAAKQAQAQAQAQAQQAAPVQPIMAPMPAQQQPLQMAPQQPHLAPVQPPPGPVPVAPTRTVDVEQFIRVRDSVSDFLPISHIYDDPSHNCCYSSHLRATRNPSSPSYLSPLLSSPRPPSSTVPS